MKFIARSNQPRHAAFERPDADPPRVRRDRSRGQVLVIFAGAAFLLIAVMALVIDLSWYWANTLKVQRAVDAAALAGAVDLPGSPGTNALHPAGTGVGDALTVATQNGYTATGSLTIDAHQDANNGNQMDVTISAPVSTFFLRIIGIQTLTATRSSKALFVLPVPMGSPENYYGVYCLTTPTLPNCGPTNAVPDAKGSGTLASKGFWGVVITPAGDQSLGDAYSTTKDSVSPGTNVDYDPAGYAYTVVIPAGGGGKVWVYDPTFCATGANGPGNYGVGDHWDNTTWNSVSTYYNLYATNNTPYKLSDDTPVAGATSGTLFEHMYQWDKSGTYGTLTNTPSSTSADGYTGKDCSADPYHNKWWLMASGLNAGTYRLQVTTTKVNPAVAGGTTIQDASVNSNTTAHNMFALEVASTSGNPQVYGSGRMAAWNTIAATGSQKFYLAQLDQTAAGKTLEIDLFDVGDVDGGSTLTILSPDQSQNPDGLYHTVNNIDFSTFNPGVAGAGNCTPASGMPCSANGVSQIVTDIVTNGNNTRAFGNTWLKILIPLPSNYGCALTSPGNPCLKPTGETGQGWWKVNYQVSAAWDTTTWQVNLRGNPVHLLVP
jgi:Flp pilus assembly protein TadG